jgi:hypothetical protein
MSLESAALTGNMRKAQFEQPSFIANLMVR